MRHPGISCFIALALLAGSAVPGRTQAPPDKASISITSMPAPDSAVLNAGANAGLAVGQELSIVKDGSVVGKIVLAKVDNETATGRVEASEGRVVSVLDSVIIIMPAGALKVTPPDNPTATAVRRFETYNEHPDDIIPWERWEYMALASLAVDGLTPGYSARDFQATRQFTRGQLAGITARALLLHTSGLGADRDAALLKRLAEAFRNDPGVQAADEAAREIKLDRPSRPSLVPFAPGLSVYAGARAWRYQADNKAAIVGRVGGIQDISGNAFVALSVSNLHRLTSAKPQAFTAVDVATLNFRALDTDWEFGKTYWSSGPVYSGDGLLSNNSPGMFMAKARKNFSWGSFPGKFIGTQIYGGFHDDEEYKYFGMRRIETRINKRYRLGLGEAYISTHAPNPLSLVLPYYAYQRMVVFGQGLGGHKKGGSGNDTFNYMAQVDVSTRIKRNVNAYVELIVDDISAPSGLGVGDVPRKTGFVVGMHFPTLFGSRGEGRFEIYNADRELYMGIAPQVGWSNNDLLLGNPYGPNTQAFFGRLDYRFTDQVKGSLQLRDSAQFHNGLPDMGDRFEMALTAAYDITPSQSVSLRWVPQRYRGQGYTLRPNALELLASYAY